MSDNKKILVIGGGIAGLSAARTALQHGHTVTLIEATDRLGGLLRSIEIDDRAYDIGTFIFTGEHPMLTIWPEVAPLLFRMQRPVRRSRVINKGHYDSFPFSIKNLVKRSSVIDLAKISFGYIGTLNPKQPTDFPTWVASKTGKSFYKITGLKNYVERFFGLPDHQVSMQFARDRLGFVNNLDLKTLAKRKLKGTRDTSSMSYIQAFKILKPENGFKQVFGTMRGVLEASPNFDLSLNECVTQITQNSNAFDVTTNKRSERFDQVILAAPAATILNGQCKDDSEVAKSFGLISLFVKGNLKRKTDVLLNYSPYGRWKRLVNFTSLYEGQDDTHHFTVEIVAGETPETQDPEIAYADFLSSLAKLSIFEGEVTLMGTQFTPNAYPKLTLDQEDLIELQKKKIADLGISIAGRQGQHRHIGSGKSVATAVQSAEALSKIQD